MMTLDPGRILIVDDDEAGRYAWARLLRDAGHTVFETSSAADGEVLLRECLPELVVLDVHLPDGNGIELTRQLKADDQLKAIMVLQMSASFVHDADQVRGLEAGADAYLTEPTSPGVFLATVRALLRLSRAERALKDALAKEHEARAEAEAANLLKDDFLANLSHELRTPLQAIVSWAAVLRTPGLERSAFDQAVEVITRNARAQTTLIEDLLDISRITSGQLKLDWATVDLMHTLRDAVESLRPAAQAKGVAVEADLAKCAPAPVLGDPMRLQQVFWNLLTNAVKFTPNGGTVSIRASVKALRAQVAIADTGRGISPEFLPRVFDRFRRGESASKGTEPGLGLGLAIAHDVVMLHGGELKASSDGPGRGATFTVTLPVLQPASPMRIAGEAPRVTES
jgi:signal transduction histidine kinase